jgi:hypothetical protein
MTNYLFILEDENREYIDEISLDENSPELAESLFYNEFRNIKKPGNRIYLDHTYEDDDKIKDII